MGFFDKLKGAVNAVTGGAAKVTIEYQPKTAIPGESIQVKITATSTGKEVKSKGIFVDLRGNEEVNMPKGTARSDESYTAERETIKNEIQVAPAFVLAAGETQTFEANVQLPAAIQPTYDGVYTKHHFQVRGRVEAFGNDPDSGWQPIRIGTRN